MNRFKNILLVVNPENEDDSALTFAETLAIKNDARLTLFCVEHEVPSGAHIANNMISTYELLKLIEKDRQKKINIIANRLRKQALKVKTKVVTGIPFLEIIRQVLSGKHDLVMMTAKGKGGLKERLFGSTAMHLMRKCPCPVWVVKPSRNKQYNRILAAIDTTVDVSDPERASFNKLIMQLASTMARMNNAELHVVQVWSVYLEEYLKLRSDIDDNTILKLRRDTKLQYQNSIGNLLAEIDMNGVVVQKHLPRSNEVSETIVKLAQRKKIDLLVMGTVCRTGIAGFLIGNIAEKVLNKVNCSVLTVKPESFVSPVTLVEA